MRQALRNGIAAAVMLACSGLALGHPGGCFETWWRGRVDALRAARGSAAALLPLRQVVALRGTAADPLAVDAALREVARLPDVAPLVRDELESVLLARDVAQLDEATARVRRQRLGLVGEALVAGPFKDLPADLWQDLQRPDGGRFRRLATGPAALWTLDGVLNPPQRGSAVIAFYLRAVRETDIALRYGADDHGRLVLDDEPLPAPEGRHDAAFDQHAVFVRFKPGWHRVALIVGQEEGAWNASVRVSAPLGGPVGDGVVLEWPADRAAAESAIRAARGKSFKRLDERKGATPTAELESVARSGDPHDIAALALELFARRLPDRQDTRALTLAREAAERAPADPDVQWVRATVETDASRRRGAFEAILAHDPQHPAALRLLAQYHLSFGQEMASLADAKRAQAACDAADPYLVGWRALAEDGGGFLGGAIAALRRITEEYPHQGVLLDRLAAMCRRDGQARCARSAIERLLALDRADEGVRDAQVRELADAGDVDAALASLEEAMRLDPLDVGWRTRAVRLLLGAGRLDAAAQLAATSLVLAPGEPDLTRLLGDVHLAQGDAPGAVDAYTKAVGSTADDGSLTERIAAITGTDDSFGSEWSLTLDQARAIEQAIPIAGDPPVAVLSKTAAFRVQPSGLGDRFQQLILRVRHADRADSARSFSVTYAPGQQRAAIVEARIIRKDGSVVPGGKADRPLLPDPELRMWYDTRVIVTGFTRLEDGDLIEIKTRVTDRTSVNPIGDGYFGDLYLFGEEVPVLASRLVLDAPRDLPIRYRLVNLPLAPGEKRLERGARVVTVVDLPTLPGYSSLPQSPPATTRVPYATVGTTTDWATIGKLYARLLSDVTQLDPDAKQVVANVTAKAYSRRQIVQALYDWVIENTRYVALEFGINAIKPYAVPLVFRRRHGDCKDKATLLMAMMREAGVKSHVALVRTRDRGPIDTSVPSFALFDHAIVYVPGEDLWLDGTVVHHSLGELPYGDHGALSLIVDTEGGGNGTLTTIPEARAEDSVVERREELRPQAGGDALFTLEVESRGEAAARDRTLFRQSDQPGRVLQGFLRDRWPDINLVGSTFPRVGLDDRVVRFTASGRIGRFGVPSGQRVMFPLSLDPPRPPLELPSQGRPVGLDLPQAYAVHIDVRFVVPAGLRLVEPPRAGKVESRWGVAELAVRRSDDGLKLALDLTWTGGAVDVGDLAAFGAFAEELRQLFGQRVALEPIP